MVNIFYSKKERQTNRVVGVDTGEERGRDREDGVNR